MSIRTVFSLLSVFFWSVKALKFPDIDDDKSAEQKNHSIWYCFLGEPLGFLRQCVEMEHRMCIVTAVMASIGSLFIAHFVFNGKKTSIKKKKTLTFFNKNEAEEDQIAQSKQLYPIGCNVLTKDNEEEGIIESFDPKASTYVVSLKSEEHLDILSVLHAAELATIQLKEIYIYPIKSCRGICLEKAQLSLRGLQNDRTWMFVDAKGNFLSQRKYPKMALIVPKLDDINEPTSITLSAAGMEDLKVPLVTEGTQVQVRVWGDHVEAIDQGEKASEWINRFLMDERKGKVLRFVHVMETFVRETDTQYAPGYQTGFADGFPYLLSIDKSLDKVNENLKEPIPMNRFRANLVLTGSPAFADERWDCLMIGDVRFRNVKPCSRCNLPCVDQSTGIPNEEREPQKTLTAMRNGLSLQFTGGKKHDTYFGSNLVADVNEKDLPLQLKVGDTVRILTMKKEIFA